MAVAAATTIAAVMMEAKAMVMVASIAAKVCNNDNNINTTMPKMTLTPTRTRKTSKRMTMRETTGGRTAVAAVAATTIQRICHPTLPLVLHNAGTTAVLFVNKASFPLSKSPFANVVYISAGQK